MERPEHETNDVVPTRTQLFFEETKRNNHPISYRCVSKRLLRVML